MLSITTSIGKAIKTISDFLMGKAQRLTSWLKNIAEKLGGVEQLLKLIVMVATALFLATNGSKILSFLAGAVKLLQGFNLQTALAAANGSCCSLCWKMFLHSCRAAIASLGGS